MKGQWPSLDEGRKRKHMTLKKPFGKGKEVAKFG
jgi:hypothetical protein